jgi:hypothetical protein
VTAAAKVFGLAVGVVDAAAAFRDGGWAGDGARAEDRDGFGTEAGGCADAMATSDGPRGGETAAAACGLACGLGESGVGTATIARGAVALGRGVGSGGEDGWAAAPGCDGNAAPAANGAGSGRRAAEDGAAEDGEEGGAATEAALPGSGLVARRPLWATAKTRPTRTARTAVTARMRGRRDAESMGGRESGPSLAMVRAAASSARMRPRRTSASAGRFFLAASSSRRRRAFRIVLIRGLRERRGMGS